VELLQAVRFDLNERASVIRTQPSAVRGWPRWQWVAAACSFGIVASLGLLQFRQMHRMHLPVAAVSTQPANQDSASSPQQTASNAPPISGENSSTNNSQSAQENPPTFGVAPQSGLDIEGKRGGSRHVYQPSAATEAAAHSDQSKPATSGTSETPTQVADSNPAGANSKLSTGQEKVAAAETPLRQVC